MSNVFDAAEYVLSKLGPTPTMKLHKLVYYCQAWSLALDGTPLFPEDFEAWANSFVCPALYQEHRGVFVVDSGFFKNFVSENAGFSPESIETMDAVLREYGDKPTYVLTDLTRMENPWKLARFGLAPGQPSNTVISKESMQIYYSGILDSKM